MNKAAVDQALTGLIPTLNGPIPAELVELASSLLARSRSVASSLKPDEEIARPYACAQLACERLKKRLNLPTITPRPPCPPRIYKKLYTYLESALPAPAPRAPETPKKTAPPAPARATPKAKTPLSFRKTPRSTAKEKKDSKELPDWTMPTIRALCKEFQNPSVAPHVFTGVESTFPVLARMSAGAAPSTPSKRPRRAGVVQQQTQATMSEMSDSRLLALIAVILFYVLSALKPDPVTPAFFLAWKAAALTTLRKTAPGTRCPAAALSAEIDTLMPMAHAEGWLQMEWYYNCFPDSEAECEDEDEMDGVEMTSTGVGAAKAEARERGNALKESFRSADVGLGTMRQEATDYLGERRREEYGRWREEVLGRIKDMEAK